MTLSTDAREIVIIGGGIIGCTTAYYITSHKDFVASATRVVLLEASVHGVAQGASGKAGGLVARWAYPKEIVDLSFDEHVKLANEHNGKDLWGWRYVNCGSWEGRGEILTEDVGKSLEKDLGLPGGQKPLKGTRATSKKRKLPEDLLWVQEELTNSYTSMAKRGDTAQVHPYQFTTTMFDLARKAGLEHIQGRATEILHSSGVITGVKYLDAETNSTQTLGATHVVVASGAWSPTLIPSLPLSATRAHSITIRPTEGTSIAPYVLFTEFTTSTGAAGPEIYARPDNEVYACGPGDDLELPPTVDEVQVNQDACDLISKQATSISKELREGIVEKRQACYLPTVNSHWGGGPLIGELKSVAKGLFVGTGHTCWGISNGPGTAKALSELLMDGKITCASLEKLDPLFYKL